MLEALMNPGSMTQDQWMIVGILFFIFIGILYFCFRTYRVIRESMNEKYTPNIGLSRMEKEGRPIPGANKPDKD